MVQRFTDLALRWGEAGARPPITWKAADRTMAKIKEGAVKDPCVLQIGRSGFVLRPEGLEGAAKEARGECPGQVQRP